MSVKLKEQNAYNGKQDSGIGANSLALTEVNFVAKAGSVVALATASDRIVWVNDTLKTYTADNETVAFAPVNFTPKEVNALYTVTITGGTVTVADEWKFYNLSTSILVDGATESTVASYVKTDDAGVAVDAVVYLQLELIEFISATEWVFKIVNL